MTEKVQTKVLHVSANDSVGGAARAAYRIHRSLVQFGHIYSIDSAFRVIYQNINDETIIGGEPALGTSLFSKLCRKFDLLKLRVHRFRFRNFESENSVLHSEALSTTGLGVEVSERYRAGSHSILHLHWLGNQTFSIEELGAIRQPVVWTLHDQWPFCGAEHYVSPPRLGDCESLDKRFSLGYSKDSRDPSDIGPDLNRSTWLRKLYAWQSPMHVVCTTKWMADCVRSSTLMHDWPVSVIPYPIDLAAWAPFDRAMARNLLNLPLDKTLILFGADGGIKDYRKGADLLFQAFAHFLDLDFVDKANDIELVVFGQSRPSDLPDLGLPIHFVGRVQEDFVLRLYYAAADLMVVPSRLEAFGQTASEALSCGIPVVAFRTGGLVDVIDDLVTGALADPFSPRSLAAAMHWVLHDPQRRIGLGIAARERALKLWSPKRIVGKYAAVYRQEIESFTTSQNI